MAGGFANFDSCIINKKTSGQRNRVKIYGGWGWGRRGSAVDNELLQADCQKLI